MTIKLKGLTEELGKLVATAGITNHSLKVKAEDIPEFEALRKLAMASSKDIENQDFNSYQLRLLNTFIIGVQFARTMTPTAARGYLGAMWLGGARSVVHKLVFGSAIERNMETFLAGGPHG